MARPSQPFSERRQYLILLLFILLTMPSFAQFSISGRVLNDEDMRPVPLASVFLTGTSIGDKTAPDGAFKLNAVKPGKYNLVISMIGFKTYKKELIIDANISLGDISIQPKITTLKEITIKPEKHRDFDLEIFKQEFLGHSDMALDCKIINPDVLNLQYDDDADTLSGSSDGFLLVENTALGYIVKYQLDNFFVNNKNFTKREVSFSGSVLFEEMNGTPGEKASWKRKRRQVYQNSSMHFFRAVLNDDLLGNCFEVLQLKANVNFQRPPDSIISARIKYYKKASRDNAALKDSLIAWQEKEAMPRLIREYVPQPQEKKDIYKPTNIKGIFALYSSNHNAGLEIFYNEHKHFRLVYDEETSLLNFKKEYAFFDSNGVIINPNDVLITGTWANNRIAQLLPFDYDPQEASN